MAAEKRDNEEEDVKTDDGSPKIKRRPIVQLGILLIAHSPVFSVVFSVDGVLALLLLPLLAKNTYMSENALMPGSARSMLYNQDVSEGSKLVNDIKDFKMNHEGCWVWGKPYNKILTALLKVQATLALLRHPDYCISCYSFVDVKRSIEEGEKRFNQLSIEERGKFDEETLVNVNNIKRQSSKMRKASDYSNEYIV